MRLLICLTLLILSPLSTLATQEAPAPALSDTSHTVTNIPTERGAQLVFPASISERFRQSVTVTSNSKQGAQATYSWTSPNKLSIHIDGSYSIHDTWTVRLDKEATYENGDPIHPGTWTISAPVMELEAIRPTAEEAKGTVYIIGGKNDPCNWCKEGAQLSPQSPFEYTYTDGQGKTIRGQAISIRAQDKDRHPSPIDLIIGTLADRMQAPPDAVIPGIVKVIPIQPLAKDKEWKLSCTMYSMKKHLFRPFEPVSIILSPLRTTDLQFSYTLSHTDDRRLSYTPLLILTFNADIAIEDQDRVFRDGLIIEIDGRQAVQDPHSSRKHIDYQGKTVSFELEPTVAQLVSSSGYYQWYDRDGTSHGRTKKLACTNTFYIKTQGCEEIPVHIRLKDGAKARWGMASMQDQGVFHRCVPPQPALSITPRNESIQPLSSDIPIAIASTGMKEITLKTRKIPAAHAVQMLLKHRRTSDPTCQAETLAHILIGTANKYGCPVDKAEKMIDPDTRPLYNRTLEHIRNAAQTALENDALYQTCPASHEKKHSWNLPAQDLSTVSTQIRYISWKTLYEAPPSPGMYHLHAEGTPSDTILRSVEQFGIRPASLFLQTIRHREHAIIQLTNIDAYWLHGETDICVGVHSLKTGAPLDKASVTLYDHEGNKISTGKTSGGTASLPTSAGPPPAWILIEHGEDYVLFPYFSERNLYANHSPQNENNNEIDVMAFSDRPIYRPGETMHIKIISRQLARDGNTTETSQAATLTLYDQKKRIIHHKKLEWSEFGTADTDIVLSGISPGTYTYAISFDGIHTPERPTPFSYQINVQEYRRDSFTPAIDLTVSNDDSPTATIRIKAIDYTGMPVVNGQVQLTLTSQAAPITFTGYGDYHFGNSGSVSPKETPETHRFKLNEQGEGSLDIPLQLAPDSGNRLFTANAIITNDVGDVRICTAETTVHHTQNIIGICLKNQPHTPKKTAVIKLVCLTPEGLPWNRDIPVQLDIEQKGEWDPKTQANTYKLIHTGQCIIQAAKNRLPLDCGTTYTFTAPEPGTYRVSVKYRNEEGETKTLTRTCNITYSHQPNIKNIRHISLRPEQSVVPAGSPVVLLADTFLQGSVTILYGKKNIYKTATVHLATPTNRIRIPLSEQDAPLTEIRLVQTPPLEDDETRTLITGACHVKIEQEARKLTIKLDTPASPVLPGSETTISGTVTDMSGAPAHSEITLYVEDEGALTIDHYQIPEPLLQFTKWDYNHLRLETCRQSFIAPTSIYTDLIAWFNAHGYHPPPHPLLSQHIGNPAIKIPAALPQPPAFRGCGMETIGMGGIALGQNDTSPSKATAPRKDFRPCTFWKADIVTDESGRFSVTYRNPDTLTTNKIITVAVGKKNRFGTATASYTISKPIMLTAGFPRCMSTGDHLQIPVTATNNSSRTGRWILQMDHQNHTLQLKPGEQKTVPLALTAQEKGTRTILCRIIPMDEANSPEWADALATNVEIIHPAPIIRKTHSFVLNRTNPAFNLSPHISKEFNNTIGGHISMSLSTSPELLFSGHLDFLLTYPYGCLEQTSSSTLPWLLYDTLQHLGPMQSKTREEATSAMQHGISRLLQKQNPDGGFAYWTAGEATCIWATPYAARVLLLAKNAGIDLPNDAWQQCCKYLQNIPADMHPESAALAAYVLALAQYDNTRIIKALLAAPQTLNRTSRLYLALALLEKNAPEDKNTVARLINEQTTAQNNSYLPASHTALLFMIELKLRPERMDQTFVQWLRHQQKTAASTTWASGWDLIALDTYCRMRKTNTTQARINLKNTDKSETLTIGTDTSLHTRATSADIPDLKSIAPAIQHRSGSPVYAYIVTSALSTELDYEGESKYGIRVNRIYEVRQNNGTWVPSSQFKIGDIVRITVSCTKDRGTLHYTALEDFIPACMEAVNPAIRSQDISSGIQSIHNQYTYSRQIDHQEFRKESVRSFASRWDHGTLTMTYLARVVRAGTVTAAPAKAELMYDPSTYGYSASKKIKTTAK